MRRSGSTTSPASSHRPKPRGTASSAQATISRPSRWLPRTFWSTIPASNRPSPGSTRRPGMGIVGRHAVAQRVLAAAAGDHQGRQGGGTAAGGDDGGATLPGRDQRLEDRRLLAAEQEAVDQPALIAAGDQEAVEPGDALDQGRAAGLAAQPVARGARGRRRGCRAARGARRRPRRRGLRLRGGGGDHAHRLGDEPAQLGQQRVAGAQRAAEQDEAAGRRARPCRPGRGCGSTRRCSPAAHRRAAGRSRARSRARPGRCARAGPWRGGRG